MPASTYQAKPTIASVNAGQNHPPKLTSSFPVRVEPLVSLITSRPVPSRLVSSRSVHISLSLTLNSSSILFAHTCKVNQCLSPAASARIASSSHVLPAPLAAAAAFRPGVLSLSPASARRRFCLYRARHSSSRRLPWRRRRRRRRPRLAAPFQWLLPSRPSQLISTTTTPRFRTLPIMLRVRL